MLRRLALFALLISTSVVQVRAQAPLVTRAEAVVFLFQVSQQPLPAVNSTTPLFSDVPAGSLQEQALQAAVERGMIGVNLVTRSVGADSPVSRGEYLRMLAILFSLPQDPSHHYTDIPRSAAYAPYVGIAERCKLFHAEQVHKLQPEESLLIHEAAEALYTLLRCGAIQQATGIAAQGLSAQTSSARVPQSLALPMRSLLMPPLLPFPTATEQRKLQIIALVNQERMAAGLLPLVRNAQIEQAAQAHARDMYKRGYFSHYSPEGLSYIDRIRQAQYLTLPPELCPCQAVFNVNELLDLRSEVHPNYFVTKRSPVCNCNPRFALGENIARGQQTAAVAVQQWMASPAHRQAILQSLFRETGVGVYGDVWVQEFGSLSLE